MTLKHDLEAAKDAAKKAFKTALDANYDENTLSELWRHYLGLNRIYQDAPADNTEISTDPWILGGGDYNFNLSSDYLTGPVAADTISFSSSGGADVISFGDYADS